MQPTLNRLQEYLLKRDRHCLCFKHDYIFPTTVFRAIVAHGEQETRARIIPNFLEIKIQGTVPNKHFIGLMVQLTDFKPSI